MNRTPGRPQLLVGLLAVAAGGWLAVHGARAAEVRAPEPNAEPEAAGAARSAGRPSGPPARRYGWSVGAGLIAKSQPYKGHDGRYVPIPVIAYTSPRFQFFGPVLNWTFFERAPFSAAVTAIYRFDGYEAEDAEIFEGLEDRKDTVEGGLRLDWQTEDRRWRIDLFAAGDTLDRHGGFRGELMVRRTWRVAGGRWAPELGLEAHSPDYVNYYYGVAAEDARPDRPAWNPGGVVQPRVGFSVNQPLTENWSLSLRMGAVWLAEDIRNSPLVDEEVELTSFLFVSRLL